MKIPLFQIDAFTDRVFAGNPAAVIPLTDWLSDDQLQQIASENNLSETAFFTEEGSGGYHIRWFTPETEVDLCGHATLATAHVILNHLGHKENKVTFKSKSGELGVEKKGEVLWLDFPSNPPEPVPMPKLIPEALGVIPAYSGFNVDLILLLDSEETVRSIRPDISILRSIDARGIIITAPGDNCDFVSRFFAPKVGVPEDPVTGSAHTVLTPFWAARLKKDRLSAKQISKRGGDLSCELNGKRVKIGGSAITYLQGEINL